MWALAADPRQVLRPGASGNAYAPWVVAIARVKLALLPWYWGKS